MRDRALPLLKKLTEAHSVSGHEGEVRDIFIKELKSKGKLETDRSGSILCTQGEKGPRILIAGHMDEVGFMVQNITPDGFIQFITLGGWWTQVLLGQRVEILTHSGKKVLGVIGSRPPHFLSAAEKDRAMSIDSMFIDVGASSKCEIMEEYGISLGDPIAPFSAFTALEKKGRYMAKAFDNRVGMACVIQAASELSEKSHPNQLLFAGSVQEEVGLRGAKTLANFAQPDLALVLEGPPADDTPGFSHAESQGRLGGGVQIRFYDPSAIANPRLVDFVVETARRANIPHQLTVRRSGGTDAGSFHLANQGIPTIVLGTPARYIHSHNAIIDIKDYLAMLKLTIELAQKLDESTVASFTKFL